MRKTYADGHIPEVGTNMRIVLDYFFEVGEATTETARIELADELERDTVTGSISNLRADGFLAKGRFGLCVSAAGRRTMEAALRLVNTAAIVQPPVRNVLTCPALHKSRFLNTKGTRGPESDWSIYPSVNAPMSKPV